MILGPVASVVDNQAMKTLRGERGIVIDWLLKALLFLAIVSVVIFDAGSIAVNLFGLDSAADEIANIVATRVFDSPDRQFNNQEIYLLASQAIDEFHYGGAKLIRKQTFIDPQGVVHIKLRRTAKTLVVGRIDFIEDWAKATAEGTAAGR